MLVKEEGRGEPLLLALLILGATCPPRVAPSERFYLRTEDGADVERKRRRESQSGQAVERQERYWLHSTDGGVCCLSIEGGTQKSENCPVGDYRRSLWVNRHSSSLCGDRRAGQGSSEGCPN